MATLEAFPQEDKDEDTGSTDRLYDLSKATRPNWDNLGLDPDFVASSPCHVFYSTWTDI